MVEQDDVPPITREESPPGASPANASAAELHVSRRPSGLVAVRHRAPSMHPSDRRAAIIAAALPLLCEHGGSVTTGQIAQAAGIAEGTIFRVFPEKRDLLVTALRTAMRGDAEVERIREIPLNVPVAERLTAALTAIGDYLDRFWALIRVFRELGWSPVEDIPRDRSDHPMSRIGGSIAALFEPERAHLRMEPRAAARMLLALALSNRMAERDLGEPAATADQLVRLFLHGALGPSEGAQPGA